MSSVSALSLSSLLPYRNCPAVFRKHFSLPEYSSYQNMELRLPPALPKESVRHRFRILEVHPRFSFLMYRKCPVRSEAFLSRYSLRPEGSDHQMDGSDLLFCGFQNVLRQDDRASARVPEKLPALPKLQSSSYFPLSAISNSISCSLIPTIASPRSVESSAINFASV